MPESLYVWACPVSDGPTTGKVGVYPSRVGPRKRQPACEMPDLPQGWPVQKTEILGVDLTGQRVSRLELHGKTKKVKIRLYRPNTRLTRISITVVPTFDADIIRLFLSKDGARSTACRKVQFCHFLIELLRQEVTS